MDLKTELQYLHDKLENIDLFRLNFHFLPALRGLINTNGVHAGFTHDVKVELSKIQDEAVINRFGKEPAAVYRDIDITRAAHDFFYATVITYRAIGTKQESSVAKYQGVRLAKAKIILDSL